MELWIEYITRKRLFHLLPPEEEKPLLILVRPDYETDLMVWLYFLNVYQPIIRMFSCEMSDNCDRWMRDKNPWRPPLDYQRHLIFQVVPHLETVWQSWANHIS
jgi:hypothetical protein